jgi:MoaA/NifB/PqqE/SkfB family radical SAM enzyme
MAASLFGRICRHLPAIDRVTLHGIGEPTLNPEFPAIVEIAARSGRFGGICVNTHAQSRTADYYRDLVARGISELYVSVDSLTQSVADCTRTGTRVDVLRRQLERFVSMDLPVFITTVASRFNVDDLPATFDALNGLGRFTVNVQPFFDLGRPDGCLSPDDCARIRYLFTQQPDRWPQLVINSALSLSDRTPGSFCPDPWCSVGVTVDGYLTPCCLMWDPAILGHLDLADVALEDALGGTAYRDFLADFVRTPPPFCQGCLKSPRPVARAAGRVDRHPVMREVPGGAASPGLDSEWAAAPGAGERV